MPVLECTDGRPALEHGLRELAVVELDVTQHRLFEIPAAAEPATLQDVLDPAVDGLRGDPMPLRQDPRRLVTRPDRRPHLWRGRRLLVKRNQHAGLA